MEAGLALQIWTDIVKKIEDLLETNKEIIIAFCSETSYNIRDKRGVDLIARISYAGNKHYMLAVWAKNTKGDTRCQSFTSSLLQSVYDITKKIYDEGYENMDTANEITKLANKLIELETK